MKTTLILSLGLALFLQDQTVVVKHPKFAQIEFMDYDQLRYVEFFDGDRNRVYPSETNYLSGVDSCAAHLVFDVITSYHPVTVLQDKPHKLIATYKRLNDSCWHCSEGTLNYTLVENRQTLVERDTLHKENPLIPGETVRVVTEYYEAKSK